MEIEVYKFGENGNDKWYEDKNGVRTKCEEEVIDKLWHKYIIHPEADRLDDDEYTIFTINTKPITIEI